MGKQKSRINVCQILTDHVDTFKMADNNYSNKDKRIFIYYPIIFSTILIYIVGKPSDSILDIFTLSLSVFIGLFLNLLVLILSTINSKTESHDKEGRKELITQTFKNISYTIILGLISLAFVLLVVWQPFNEETSICLFSLKITANNIFGYTFSYILYLLITELVLTLLMVLKRIYKLFHVDIQES